MATEVTCIVDTDGTKSPDYTSLSAAIAGETGESPKVVEDADLVANDEQLTIECRCSAGGADTAANVVVTGFTVDATCYVKVYVPPAHRHSGKWNESKYRVARSSGNNAIVTSANNYTRFIGLQARNAETWGTHGAFGVTGSYCRFGYCLANSSRALGFYLNGDFDAVVYNCLAYGGDTGFGFRRSTFYNCTAIGGTRGYYNLYSAGTAHNCLASGASTADFAVASTTPTLNNCASGDGTADDFNGSNNRVDQEFTFVDAGNDDYRLASNDAGARNHGATDPGSGLYSDDIIGTARPQGAAWDIGAFEAIAAVATWRKIRDGAGGIDPFGDRVGGIF